MSTENIIAIIMIMAIGAVWATRLNRGASKRKPLRISAQEVKRQLDSGDKLILIDVRTKEEYAKGHIPKSLSLPTDTIQKQVSNKIVDKTTPVALYCESGGRSSMAAKMLVRLGYENVYDMGSIRRWSYGLKKGKQKSPIGL